MKKLFLFICSFFCLSVCSADSEPSFDLQFQSLNQVVSLYYKEVVKRPYVLCDDVIKDSRYVSIRASGKQLDSAVVSALLDRNGYEAKEERGIVVVCTKQKVQEVEDLQPFFYRPLYRDASYLVDILSPLVKGTFANKRVTSSLSVGGGNASLNQNSPIQNSVQSSYKPVTSDDYILFHGTEKEHVLLRKLLSQIDVPTGEVVIKGYVYEVGKNVSESSAVQMLTSLLQGKFQISVSGNPSSNSVRIKAGGIDVIASAINSDGRFKVVTSPYTRVRSGSTARFQVGADVPVLGAIVSNGNGQTSQSVEYRSSGTLLEVSPKVRDKVTDVDLFQQVSSFVSTENGVNGSPTLNKRELRTSLSVEDGEVLVIGGLNDSTVQDTKSGLWFLPFSISKSSGSRSTELLLVLELKRI